MIEKLTEIYLGTAVPSSGGGSSGGAVESVNGKTGAVTLTKADVGLGNVDNTSDANKPVSTAQQAALDLKQSTTDNTLQTTSKTVTGAINEINSKLPVYTTVPELTADYIIQVNPTNVEHIYYISIGDTVYNVTGADGIKWVDGIAPVAAANTTLVVSVINNLAVWGGF